LFACRLLRQRRNSRSSVRGFNDRLLYQKMKY
jgi:hypothetical protein